MTKSIKFSKLFEPVKFTSGKQSPNRFMVAPLTNMQSHEDGTLSDDEYKWLTLRAQGGYGLTMTCASHVQQIGKGFPGQLGCFSDNHIDGLTRLSTGINSQGSISIVQLHHAGVRTPQSLINEKPVAPSEFKDGDLEARGLSTEEVNQLISDFVEAAKRCQKAGFDGVEVHGAHGYILTQFLSTLYNKRNDSYGGSLENRSRILFDILKGIKAECGDDFVLGIRLSPELHGLNLQDVLDVSQKLIDSELIDFLDVSIWDVFKKAEDEKLNEHTLISLFASLDWKNVKYIVAGKIYTPEDALWCLEQGADMVALGKMAILHHDYPNKLEADESFLPVATPVTRGYLEKEGLGETFIDYMQNRWKGFVE